MANCSKRETVVKGSDFRLRIHITNLGENIHLSDQNVSLVCTLHVKDTTLSKQKPDLIPVDQDTYIMAVSTADLAKGDVILETHTGVPDIAFQDGVRDEIVETDTGVTIV